MTAHRSLRPVLLTLGLCLAAWAAGRPARAVEAPAEGVELEALFQQALAATGGEYVAARDAIVRQGEAAEAFLRRRMEDADWHVSVLAAAISRHLHEPSWDLPYREEMAAALGRSVVSRGDPCMRAAGRARAGVSNPSASGRSAPWRGFEGANAALFLLEVATKGCVRCPPELRGGLPAGPPGAVYSLEEIARMLDIPENHAAAYFWPGDNPGWSGECRVRRKTVERFVNYRKRQEPSQLYALEARCFATARVAFLEHPAVGPALVELLEGDPVWQVRKAAAMGLGDRAGAERVAALVAALRDPSRDVRRTAAYVLGTVGDEAALEPLAEGLKDASLSATAAKALAKIGGPKAAQALIAALRDESYPSRQRAATALRNIGGKEALDALLDALRDEDAVLRGAAAGALGGRGDPRAVPHLIEAMDGAPDMVRSAAHSALRKITGQKLPKDDPQAWRQWWEQNKARLLPAEPPRAPEQAATPAGQ